MASKAQGPTKARVQGGHLLRKAQHSLLRGDGGLPSDLLGAAGVEPRFVGATGFPDTADSIAYEPAQGLLAVGTSDGRVVLIGRPGVEATLRSPSRSATKRLAFLPGRAALLRVTEDGDIQLFCALQRRLLASTWLQGDVINAVALLPGAAPADPPYALLGCESGNVRVVAVVDAEAPGGGGGAAGAGVRAAADLALQPYQVLGQDVDGRGGVMALAVAHPRHDRPLLLLVHRHSGALVWDIRAERILCIALEAEDEASKPTAACWVGGRASCFAVGYDDGSILLWGVPAAALQDDPSRVVDPPDAQLLGTLRVALRGVHAAPIRSLAYMAGSSSGSEGSLLVFGGQGEGEPDMVTLLPLAAAQRSGVDGVGGRAVPWFGTIQGFCEMPAEGLGPAAAERPPRALLILTEGGQLVVHDLRHWQPTPLTLPIQELPPITAARLVPTVSMALLAAGGDGGPTSPRSPVAGSASLPSPRPGSAAEALPQHALTLDKVRACSRRAAAQPGSGVEADPTHPRPEHWPFSGGQPAASLAAGITSSSGDGAGAHGGSSASPSAKRHPSALYFSGHRDGRVRVWDATTEVPELLLTVPPTAGQERLRAVTAMEVCPFSGILIVGHQGGNVRLYQFTESAQSVHRMNIDETLIPYENVGTQPAGFQYILRYSTHSADITAVALATKLKLAAVADASGQLSLLDLLQPAQLFCTRAMMQPVAAAAFGSHVIPGASKEDPDIERVVLFLAGADSSACMVGLDKGEPVGAAMRPKNASCPLSIALLDAGGIPLPLLHGQLVLAWANNNSGAAAAAVASRSLSAVATGAKREDAGGRVLRASALDRAAPSPRPAPSRASIGLDSHPSWSRADSVDMPDNDRESSIEVHDLPSSDDDLDSHLAAAIQAVEEEKKTKSKFKLPAAFKRPSSRGQQQQQQAQQPGEADLPSPTSSASGSLAPAAGQAAGAFDPVAALHDFYGAPAAGASAGAGTELPALGSPTLSAGLHGSEAGGAAAPAQQQQLLSEADLVDYPYLIDGDPTPAAYLLLCCTDYLRLYSTDNIRLGDRSTARKASLEAPLCFAAAFMSTHGPGVVSTDASDAVQVHSLPGLELLYRKQLEDSRALGFRWACQPQLSPAGSAAAGSSSAPAAVAAAAGAACCSLDGQLVLAGPGNELARLAVAEDCALPVPPACVYDARRAADVARRQSGGYPARLEPPAQQQQAVEGGVGFGRLLDSAASAVTSAAGTVMHELDRARVAGHTALQRIAAAGEGGAQRALPSLAVLFSTPVDPLEDDIDFMPEDEEVSPRAETASTSSAGAAAGAVGAAAAGSSAGAAASAAASGPPSARGAQGRRPASSLVSPRVAAAKLKQLMPVVRSKSERSELLERDAAAAGAAGGSLSARSAGTGGVTGGGSWAAASRERAAGGGGAGTFTRTASEIKRAYGRSGSGGGRTGEVRGIMEQNRAMLADRGERLERLDERTAAMANDATDFASLAKQLADEQAKKKWWQL